MGLLLFSETNGKGRDHTDGWLCNSRTRAAHERTEATGVITIKAVGVFSMARRNRNHQEVIMRRTIRAGTSPRLSATTPNPPPCNSRSQALKACSTLSRQRTHNKLLKSTPALAAE